MKSSVPCNLYEEPKNGRMMVAFLLLPTSTNLAVGQMGTQNGTLVNRNMD